MYLKRIRPVSEVFPDLTAELTKLLLDSEESALAPQVPHLKLVDRCRCGDSFCATFYTEKPPSGSYGPKHRNVVLDPDEGMIVLDVVEQKIMCVEVLHRPDVRAALVAALP